MHLMCCCVVVVFVDAALVTTAIPDVCLVSAMFKEHWVKCARWEVGNVRANRTMMEPTVTNARTDISTSLNANVSTV